MAWQAPSSFRVLREPQPVSERLVSARLRAWFRAAVLASHSALQGSRSRALELVCRLKLLVPVAGQQELRQQEKRGPGLGVPE